MPVLSSATSATVELLPCLGLDARMMIVVVIKELFSIEGPNRVERVGGAEIRYVDEPWLEDQPSIVKHPGDLCLFKPSTDVIVIGAATAPDRTPVKTLDVLVQVGPVERILRVFGPRVWYRGVSGLNLTSPEPFESVELRWDLAYGGYDASEEGKTPLEEPRNPVGRGLVRSSGALVHEPGPQIEDPRDLISSHRTKPVPAGVAPIGRGWEPRRLYAGTMDETWMRERMPLLPVDFDDRFNQVAPPELITPAHLRGGEPVRLHHLNADGPMTFDLPRLHFFVGGYVDGELVEHRSVLDTVLIKPTDKTLELTWRASMPLPRPAHRLEHVQVHEKELR